MVVCLCARVSRSVCVVIVASSMPSILTLSDLGAESCRLERSELAVSPTGFADVPEGVAAKKVEIDVFGIICNMGPALVGNFTTRFANAGLSSLGGCAMPVPAIR
ncbi:hypothetical protein H351_31375 (plasmid) [Rhodococcus erythropolis R138]|nr:hypothetical protein H351_31375 [Rhodococcus erythropolis R138]